jgi:hypothetical protein
MCVKRCPPTSSHHHGDFYEQSKEAQTSIDGNMGIVIIAKALRCKHFDSCTHCGEENIDAGKWNAIHEIKHHGSTQNTNGWERIVSAQQRVKI